MVEAGIGVKMDVGLVVEIGAGSETGIAETGGESGVEHCHTLYFQILSFYQC